MILDTKFIQLYAEASMPKRIEIIVKYYPNFIGVIEGSTAGLVYKINSDLRCQRNRNYTEELGVRVQNKGLHSDPTFKEAVQEMVTTAAVKNCCFPSFIEEELEDCESYMEQARILNQMRMDYDLFNGMLDSLGNKKKEFVSFITGEKSIADLADENEIAPDSARKRLVRSKAAIKSRMLPFMTGEAFA